jgi:hypothetical protein
MSSQSSLVVSWQRIYSSLTVITAHIKSSNHTLIPFLLSLLSHLRLPSQETPSIISQPDLGPLYIASGRILQNIAFPNNSSIVIELCLHYRCLETAVLLSGVMTHYPSFNS